MSRNHLPSIFPWTEKKTSRRLLKWLSPEEVQNLPRKRRLVSHTAQPADSSSAQTECETSFEQEQHPCEAALGGTTEILDQVGEKNVLNEGTREASTQTETCETRPNELEDLRQKIKKLKSEMHTMKKAENARFDIEHFKNNDDDISFYTGFPNYDVLILCYDIIKEGAKNMSYGNYDRKQFDQPTFSQQGRPRTLTTFQEFVLVLMRLRLGLFERDLAHRFAISESTVSVIVTTWIRFLGLELELILIPPRDVLKAKMPKLFKEFYPNTALIIDCTEVQMESPSALDSQSACYSSYKSRPTMKSLVGITPSGVIGFVSDLYPGSTTDKEITIKSGMLDKLESGDEIMADKGFLIQDELANIGVTLTIPAFLKGKKQFSKEEAEKNKKVASLRVHVERCMERLKNWHILDRTIPVSMAPLASDMFIVIAALTNFHPPLIS